MLISNAKLLDLECTSDEIASWVNGDTGEAASTAETNVPVGSPLPTVWKFDTKTSADTNDKAKCSKDIGSVESLGNRIVLTLDAYFDAIGTYAAFDGFYFDIRRSDWYTTVKVHSDGLYVLAGAVWNELGTNLIVQNVRQRITFDINKSGGVCDVYVNSNSPIVSNASIGTSGSYTDGEVTFVQYGYATDDRITYLNRFMIGDGFSWNGTVAGVSDIGKVSGKTVTEINKVQGVA